MQWKHTISQQALGAWRRRGWLLLLACALLGGGMARTQALYTWDGVAMLHPDERFLVYTAWYATVPTSLGGYLAGGCGTDAAPTEARGTNDGQAAKLFPDPAAKKEACSSLNPRDQAWSHIFVYGALPTTLMRVTGTQLYGAQASPLQIRNVGRTLAALAEVMSILLVFVAARAVLRREWAALASVLYALLPLPIQLSHFATVDAYASPLVVAALALLLRQRRLGWRGWLMMGAVIGAAAAVRVTALSLWLVVPLTWLVERRWPSWGVLRRVVGSGLASALVWWLCDPTIWHGWWFDARWLHDVALAARLVSGAVDTPPTFQWSWQMPYLYPLQQMIWWGMGPVAAAGVFGWLWQLRWRQGRVWPLWVWVAGYFAWTGGVFGMTMRYYLPLYAALVICALWWVVRLPRRWRTGLVTGLVLAGGVWAVAWSGVYADEHPRIAASRWIYAQVPAGAQIAVEVWDDVLPLTLSKAEKPARYTIVPLEVFTPDTPHKYLGDATTLGLLAQLDRVEYVVISSARASGVLPLMPRRFPVMTRYYAALADGSLGFVPVFRAARWPHIGGWWWDTRAAEEAFSVYDHPQVVIYQKTASYSAAQARRVLLEPSVWGSVAQVDTRTYRAARGVGDGVWVSAHSYLIGDVPIWTGMLPFGIWCSVLLLLLAVWRGRRVWQDRSARMVLAMHSGMVLALLAAYALGQVTIWGVVLPCAAIAGWHAWRSRDAWWWGIGGAALILPLLLGVWVRSAPPPLVAPEAAAVQLLRADARAEVTIAGPDPAAVARIMTWSGALPYLPEPDGFGDWAALRRSRALHLDAVRTGTMRPCALPGLDYWYADGVLERCR